MIVISRRPALQRHPPIACTTMTAIRKTSTMLTVTAPATATFETINGSPANAAPLNGFTLIQITEDKARQTTTQPATSVQLTGQYKLCRR